MFTRPIRGNTSMGYKREHHGYDDRHSHRYRAGGPSNDDIPFGKSIRCMRSTKDLGYRPQLHRERYTSPTYSKAGFSKALQQLHTTLKDSVQFFRAFEKSYLEETHSIKYYATGQIMDELWTTKAVNSDTDPSSRPSHREPLDCSRDRRWFNPQRSVPYTSLQGGNFRDHIQYIREDFENALSSGPPRSYRKQQHYRERVGSVNGGDDSGNSAKLDAESTERLMRKIAEQYKVLWKILSNIYKVRSYVQEFIKESELLVSYLEKSRNLWELEERERSRQQKGGFQPQGRKEQESRYLHNEHGYDSDQQGHDSRDGQDSAGSGDNSNLSQDDGW